MAVSAIIEIGIGTVPTTPATGYVDLYVDTADKRLKSIDETPTIRVFLDRDSTETLTNKTVTALILSAGTVTAAPVAFTSGSLMTTAGAGTMEYDGKAFYGSPTNGAVTLAANTTYYFECAFSLTGMSASSASFGFALAGTASLTRQEWVALATKSALSSATAPSMSYNVAANVTIVAASTSTTGHAFITGKIVVGTGGTLIPQVSLGLAAAAVVGPDAYFRIWPAGSDTVQSVGNWS